MDPIEEDLPPLEISNALKCKVPELTALAAQLTCNICYDPYLNPVLTSCGHSFCSLCIRKYLVYKQQCPQCGTTVSDGQLRINKVVGESSSILRKLVVSLNSLVTSKGSSAVQYSTVQYSSAGSVQSSGKRVSAPFPEENTEKTLQVKVKREPGIEDVGPIKTEKQDRGRTIKSLPVSQGKSECMICKVPVPAKNMDQHLRCCLEERTPPEQPPPRRKPLPKLVYALLKDNDLKKKCKEVGLNPKGDRKTLIHRHQKLTVLFNSECDLNSPRSLSEVVKQVEKEETLEKNGSVSNILLKFDRNSDTKSIEEKKKLYLEANKSSFSQLITKAKSKASASSEDFEVSILGSNSTEDCATQGHSLTQKSAGDKRPISSLGPEGSRRGMSHDLESADQRTSPPKRRKLIDTVIYSSSELSDDSDGFDFESLKGRIISSSIQTEEGYSAKPSESKPSKPILSSTSSSTSSKPSSGLRLTSGSKSSSESKSSSVLNPSSGSNPASKQFSETKQSPGSKRFSESTQSSGSNPSSRSKPSSSIDSIPSSSISTSREENSYLSSGSSSSKAGQPSKPRFRGSSTQSGRTPGNILAALTQSAERSKLTQKHPCPVCGTGVAERYLNIHLDKCLRNKESSPRPLLGKRSRGKKPVKSKPPTLSSSEDDDSFELDDSPTQRRRKNQRGTKINPVVDSEKEEDCSQEQCSQEEVGGYSKAVISQEEVGGYSKAESSQDLSVLVAEPSLADLINMGLGSIEAAGGEDFADEDLSQNPFSNDLDQYTEHLTQGNYSQYSDDMFAVSDNEEDDLIAGAEDDIEEPADLTAGTLDDVEKSSDMDAGAVEDIEESADMDETLNNYLDEQLKQAYPEDEDSRAGQSGIRGRKINLGNLPQHRVEVNKGPKIDEITYIKPRADTGRGEKRKKSGKENALEDGNRRSSRKRV